MIAHVKRGLPPGPRLPAPANIVRMSMDPFGFLEKCRDRYGDAFTLRQPGIGPGVFVCEPAAVKTLCTGGYDDFSRAAETIRFLLGDHAVIFQQDGEHKETRRLMVPPFHGERMRAYGVDMARFTDDMIDRFGDGERLHLHKRFQDLTLRIILRSVFGLADGARAQRLGVLLVEYLDAIMTPWFYGATLILSGARVRDFLRSHGRQRRGLLQYVRPLQAIADHVAEIDDILFDEIARCRALPAAERDARQDILAMLVASRFDDGTALSDEALRDHLMTLLIGGHETTATSLSWAIACALRAPGTIDKMRADVTRAFGDGDAFDAGKVKQLQYVGAVASESMRLYPIATAVTRQLKRDMQLAGYILPAGTLVSPCIYLVQRDPRVWSDPLRFDPERFVGGKASVYEYFPFGAGVWKCLGAQFAEYEMRVVLARLVSRVELMLDGNEPLRAVQRGFTVAPSNGLPVRVRRFAATARAA
jgi:cytochrome P450